MICYDITNTKRLQKVSKILEGYGVRSQYSFFQCDISRGKYRDLMQELLSIIDISDDRLYAYPLCDSCFGKIQTQGKGELLNIASFEIL